MHNQNGSIKRIRSILGEIQFTSTAIISLGLIFLISLTAIICPACVTVNQMLRIAKQASVLGVAAMGQTVVMLTGGIDLSIGQVLIMSEVLAADLMAGQNANILWVVLLLLGMAAVIGAINGTVIALTNIPPLIMTFAMSSVIQGGYLLYTGGAPTGRAPPFLRFIGSGEIGGLFPTPLLVWFLLAGSGIFVLRRTVFGQSLYLVGSNPQAADLSGVSVNKITITSYVISSCAAVIAGLLLVGYVGVGTMELGQDFTLNPIAASVIGGTTFAGGHGGLLGTVGGTLIMQFLGNLLIIMRMGEPIKRIIQGIIIGGMVAFYQWRKRESS
ncbi:MAG: ABC transporter permease [Candidatus Bipolaricaulota bacterium]